MEDSGIANVLNLDGATEITPKSSYQTFLQQLSIDTNSTDLYHHTHAVLKEPSISNIEVYEKNPPSYAEAQQQQHEVEGSRRTFVDAYDANVASAALIDAGGTSTLEFNDKLICKFFCE